MDRLILDAALPALSAETVILPTAHTFRLLFLRSTNLWVTLLPLLPEMVPFMLVG